MADSIRVTFVMDLKPEFAEAFKSRIGTQLVDTRAFPGCRGVNAYGHEEDPNRVILIEEWDSKEAYQAYLAWRNEQGAGSSLGKILAKPCKPEYWPILLG